MSKSLRRRSLFALAVALVASQLISCGHHLGLPIGPPVQPGPARPVHRLDAFAYPNAVLASGPVAYYRLDDTGTTAADTTLNHLNGTIGASVTKSVPGLVPSTGDTAMSFPGLKTSAGIVSVPANALFQAQTQVSMEAFLQFSATPALYTVVVCYGNDKVYAPYDLYFGAGGVLNAQFRLSTGVLLVTDPTPLQTNLPYYVVATYDGSVGKLYVNGSLVASATKSGTIIGYDGVYGLAIGDDPSFDDPGFNGVIDDVAIYSKALSASDVNTHYVIAQTGVAPTPTPTPTAPPPSAYANAVIGSGPIAYYHLDDTGALALDVSGNQLNGSIGASVVKSVPGLVPSMSDTAMSFPGVKSSAGVVSVPPNTLFQLTSQVSIEAFLKFSSTPANFAVPVNYGNDTATAPYGLYFGAGGALNAQFNLTSGALVVTDPTPLQKNTAYYVVATYDGTTGKLYVNGSLVASTAKSGTITGYDTKYGLGIGDDTSFADPAFSGVVDEVAIYAKVLGASDVSAHYAAAQGGPTPPPTPTPAPTPTPTPTPTPPPANAYSNIVLGSGPIAYYRLTDTGTTALDSSGNHLNGNIGTNVVVGAPGLVPSSSDTAMTFPGTKNAAGIVNVPANIIFQLTNQATIEAFLRFSSPPTLYAVPVGYGNDTNYAPYDLYFTAGGVLNAQFNLTSGVFVLTDPTALQPNTTYYVVATFDGATGKLYVNGSLVTSVLKSGSIIGYDSHGLGIGDDSSFADPGYAGSVAQVAIYNKVLSASDVSTHYSVALTGVGPTPTPPPTPPPVLYSDWSTFGYDLARTGYNPNENVIGTGNVGSLAVLWQTNLGSTGIVGQPVLASNVNVSGVYHNLLYVGTLSGKFAALDADTGAIVWQKQMAVATYFCGVSLPFGVGHTATFDRSQNRVFVGDGNLMLHSLDMSTGAEGANWPVSIPQSPLDITHNFVYAGLTLNPSNGIIYAETSTSCDITPWYGQIDAFDSHSGARMGSFFPAQGQSGGGIWGFGGASIDTATNDVYVATGNADNLNFPIPQNYAYDEDVVQLTPTLSVLAANYPLLPNSPDADFGATPILFGPGCTAAMNKSGVLVVYNRATIGSGPAQIVTMAPATDAGNFIGVPAFSPALNLLFVPVPGDSPDGAYLHGLAALSLQSNCTLTKAWNQVFGLNSVSASGDVPHSAPSVGNGVVYESDGPNNHVYAFDAASGAPLWNSGSIVTSAVYAQPLIDRHLFVASFQGTVYAFSPNGLAAARKATIAPPAHRPGH